MVDADRRLGLFEGVGVELEYMIVDEQFLDVRPIADQVLSRAAGGESVSDVELGAIAWSNELVLHVLELKCNGPAASLDGLGALFAEHVGRANRLLAPAGGALLPTAMHPWMDPERETRIWPHEQNEVYHSYHRIFDVHGHGWSNLQSTHINLPFANDGEFERLHAAIRLVLPLIPALAASSPLVGGRATGILDNRLEFYRTNQRRLPCVAGQVIPEVVRTEAEYREKILAPSYRAIAPHDPRGILQREWLNSRGAIARFDRGAIEIRLIDIQECPTADLAICTVLVEAIRALVEERRASLGVQHTFDEHRLAAILLAAIRDGEAAMVTDQGYIALFAPDLAAPISADTLLSAIIRRLEKDGVDLADHRRFLDHFARQGTLSRRILTAAGERLDRERIHGIYRTLQTCLDTNELFCGQRRG